MYIKNFVVIINFVSILVLFAISIFLFTRIIDNNNRILSLEEYRKFNEIQLSNLIIDIQKNDQFLQSKLQE